MLGRLADEGLQDDDRFAEAYIHYRVNRGYGAVKIGAELRQRGVDKVLLATLFERLAIDWGERARAAWRKRFGHTMAADHRERAKQARFLEYRGFTGEQITRVVDMEYGQAP